MELLTLYHISDLSTPIHVERSEVYGPNKDLYRDHKIAVVNAFVFDVQGHLILQKRGKVSHGAGKYHTTVGGHIGAGETPDFALQHESLEEIGTGATIVPSDNVWSDALSTLANYLDITLLVQQQDRYTGDTYYNYVYFGAFAGTPNNRDGSVESFAHVSLESLDAMIIEDPEQFTAGFLRYYTYYREKLYEFRDESLRCIAES